MSADAIVKSLIDRILRLKEEQDALAADIREVYAEAKGNGYDKTAMGEVVAYLRKIEKKGKDAVAERSAMFDLYLDAYERPSHTHAREGQSYAEAKGVERPAQKIEEGLKEALAVAKGEAEPARWHHGTDTQEQPETASQSASDVNAVACEYAGTSSDENPAPNSLDDERPKGQPMASLEPHEMDRHAVTAGETADDGRDVEAAGGAASVITISNSAVTPPAAEKTGAAPLPSSAAPVELTDEDVPAFLRKQSKPLRPHCLNPDLCGGSGSKHCYSCLKARDNATVAA